MTLKSNGCIIFIGALTPTKLLVTSKHSLGPIQGVPISHAQMGENWLLKHLEKSGKTTEQLASVLWEENLTAVAEVGVWCFVPLSSPSCWGRGELCFFGFCFQSLIPSLYLVV